MKKNFLAFLLIITVFIYGCSGTNSQIHVQGQAVGSKVGLNQGDFAPDFNVKTVDGKTIKLSELTSQGKPVVLYFMATWCPNCRNDLGALRGVYDKYKDDVEFVAVGIDLKESPNLLASYKSQMGLINIEIAPGSRKILSDYSVSYTTTKYGIDRNGRIAFRAIGTVDTNAWEQIFQGLLAT